MARDGDLRVPTAPLPHGLGHEFPGLAVHEDDEAGIGGHDRHDALDDDIQQLPQVQSRGQAAADVAHDLQPALSVLLVGWPLRLVETQRVDHGLRRGDGRRDLGRQGVALLGRRADQVHRLLLGELHALAGLGLGRVDRLGHQGQPRAAQTEAVAGADHGGAVDLALADEGAVGAAEVLEQPLLPALGELGMEARDARVQRHRDIIVGPSPQRDDGLVEVEDLPLECAVEDG